MKLKDYIAALNDLVQKDPSLLDSELVYETHDYRIMKLDNPPIIGHYTEGHFYAWSPVPFIEKRVNNSLRIV